MKYKKSGRSLCSSCTKLSWSENDKENYCRLDFELKPISKRPIKCDGYFEIIETDGSKIK